MRRFINHLHIVLVRTEFRIIFCSANTQQTEFHIFDCRFDLPVVEKGDNPITYGVSIRQPGFIYHVACHDSLVRTRIDKHYEFVFSAGNAHHRDTVVLEPILHGEKEFAVVGMGERASEV